MVRDRMVAVLGPGGTGPGVVDSVAGMRCPCAGDADELARLMLEAYRGTIDDGGETIELARAEVARLMAGEWGRFDAGASVVVEREGRLASATLVTNLSGVGWGSAWDTGPFVAFSMTGPAWKRKGLARAGLSAAMGRLAARGETSLKLVVTRGNEPAERLYQGLGFVREEEPRMNADGRG